jgi:hypothetical protein
MKAVFSSCRTYRYALWRDWSGLFVPRDISERMVAFIGLNPSTADETNDDPTIRRCINFAKAWGFGSLCMVNLFAYRSTDPQHMLAVEDPVGPENDAWLEKIRDAAGLVVAAWGTHGVHNDRDSQVRKLFGDRLHYLKLNSKGQPGHPLYLPSHLTPVRWVDTP